MFGTLIIGGLWSAIHLYAFARGLTWIHAGKRSTIRSLGPKSMFAVLGAIVLLWLPVVLRPPGQLTPRSTGPQVILTNIVGEQPAFEPYFHNGNVGTLHWCGFFSITNLGKDPLGIVSIKPLLEPAHYDGHVWQARYASADPISARVFESEQALMDYHNKLSKEQGRFTFDSTAPFMVQPYAKLWLIVDLFFDVFVDGKPYALDPGGTEVQNVLTHMLVGGLFKSGYHGSPVVTFRPLEYEVTTAEGQVVRTSANTHTSGPYALMIEGVHFVGCSYGPGFPTEATGDSVPRCSEEKR